MKDKLENIENNILEKLKNNEKVNCEEFLNVLDTEYKLAVVFSILKNNPNKGYHKKLAFCIEKNILNKFLNIYEDVLLTYSLGSKDFLLFLKELPVYTNNWEKENSIIINNIVTEMNNINTIVKNIEVKHYNLSETKILIGPNWGHYRMKISSDIGNFKNLNFLEIHETDGLYYLPKEVGKLENLNELNIEQCGNLLELPQTIINLNKLKILKLKYLDKFKNINNLPENIEELYLYGLQNCEINFDEIFKLKNLKILEIHSCDKIKIFPDFQENFKSLEELEIQSCNNLIEIKGNFEKLKNIKNISIFYNKKLKGSDN